jgi:predicted outer membrane lipoprotein
MSIFIALFAAVLVASFISAAFAVRCALLLGKLEAMQRGRSRIDRRRSRALARINSRTGQ